MTKVVDLSEWRKKGGGAKATTTPAPLPASVPALPVSFGGLGNMVKVEPKPGTNINADDVSAKMLAALTDHMLGSVNLKNKLNNLMPRNEGKIEQYRKLVSGYSEEQINAFLKASDSDIMRKPFFYYAIVDEAERRLALEE